MSEKRRGFAQATNPFKGERPPRLLLASEEDEINQELDRLRKLESELQTLMGSSEGVAGLHLNDDIADWDWLIDNEWLGSFRAAEG